MEKLTLQALCQDIDLAAPAAAQVLELDKILPWEALSGPMAMMAAPCQWEQGLDSLKAALAPDDQGFKMLTCCLKQALSTWDVYQVLGISREIFTATMACFSRFVGEHMASFGCYGFDRDFWTVRQLSARLFRIGQLEYELVDGAHGRQVDLHIPSGAKLQPEELRRSWEEAKDFLGKHFPDYASVPMACDSWMLSPTLAALLPENANILRFQRAFRITPLEEGNSYLEWVFKRTDLPLEVLPENTSLQRKLKAWLLSGGTWQEAEGVLVEDPFL